MDEHETLQAIDDGDSAYGLLTEADPNFERRFRRLCSTMGKLLDDVQSHFPGAQYYVTPTGLNLLLGSPHADDGEPQRELIAFQSAAINIGGGDW